MLTEELQTRLQGEGQPKQLINDEWLLLQIKDGSCSAGCRYCYAVYEALHEYEILGIETKKKNFQALMKENSPTILEMSLDTIKDLMSYINDAGIFKIAIIGSEPTEHSQFQEILNVLYDRNTSVAIYTNGRHLEKLKHAAIAQIILHLSHFPTKAYMKNIQDLIGSGKKIDLRINFSDELFSEQKIIDAFLSQLSPSERSSILIKYSVTSRAATDGVEGFDIPKLLAAKSTMLKCIEEVHKKYKEVIFYCERTLFKCCFTKKELDEHDYANITFKCSMEYIIYRDGKMKFCSPGRYLFDGYSINSANDIIESIPKLRENMKELFSLPSFPECKDCINRKTLECYGGCISYKSQVHQ